jgi:hypothetical protein
MIFGPDLVIEAEEIVHHIQSNLKAAKFDRSTMQTRDVAHWRLQLGTMCIFVSRPCEV